MNRHFLGLVAVVVGNTLGASIAGVLPCSVAGAAPPERPVGIALTAGYDWHGMSDVNRALADPSMLYPGAIGRADAIQGGASFGAGIRARPGSRLLVAADAIWMGATSDGEATLVGLAYDARVSLAAIGTTATAVYLWPVGERVHIGLGAGLGYYFTTGSLRLKHGFLQMQADVDARTVGLHEIATAEVSVTRSTTLELAAGYRHARARSLRVNGEELRDGSGYPVEVDWSGPITHMALVLYLPAR